MCKVTKKNLIKQFFKDLSTIACWFFFCKGNYLAIESKSNIIPIFPKRVYAIYHFYLKNQCDWIWIGEKNLKNENICKKVWFLNKNDLYENLNLPCALDLNLKNLYHIFP